MEFNKEITCMLSGHRKLPKSSTEIGLICKRLKGEMEKLIEQGVEVFIAGGAIGFDSIAASMVITLKELNPSKNIKLVLALPCPEQSKFWKPKEQTFYQEMIGEADEIIYTSDHYFSGCMHLRDRWMTDHSGYCICYLVQPTGGTFYTVGYATQNGLIIINIAK